MNRRALIAATATLLLTGAAPGNDAPSLPVPHTVRVGGSDLNGLMPLWEAAFARLHPEIRFDNYMASGDAAIGALEAGAVDIVANGREPVLTEFLSFAEVFGHEGPFQIVVATGSADKLGRTWAQVIYVNRANPIAHMTMAQLEGVFADARSGGYDGYRWTTTKKLPASRTIRSWGGLGLGGAWAKRPIHSYGYAPTGMSNFFESVVFHGGTRWAPGYRQYVEASAKQATDRAGTTDQMMDDLEHDPDGIAWAGVAHGKGHPNVKMIALGINPAGPFIPCTRETVAAREYPLTRSIFIQFDRAPGKPLAPEVRAFLDYVLSEAGQAVVARQDQYLALPASFAAAQRRALD